MLGHPDKTLYKFLLVGLINTALGASVMFVAYNILLAVMVSLFKDSSMVFVLSLIELTQTSILLANRYPATLIAMYCFISLDRKSVV